MLRCEASVRATRNPTARNVPTVSYARGVEYVVVGIVCAAGLVIPIALGLAAPRQRRRPRGR